MKKGKKIAAMLCALVLLMGLAGCGKEPAPAPDYEMIAVEMPEQQADVAGEKIIKAEGGDNCIWVLSDSHNLYCCQLKNNQPDMTTLKLKYQNVQDFSLSSHNQYVNILHTDRKLESRWTGYDYGTLPEPLEGVAAISGCAALMRDGTVWYYGDGWHRIDDIKAKKIAADHWARVQVLDENNTLWNYSTEDGSRMEVAQKVVDFCYTPANSLYYTSHIWYTTGETDTLYCYSYEWYDPTDPNMEQPRTEQYRISGVPVYAICGDVLLQQKNGSYLLLQPRSDEKPMVYSLPMKGVFAEARAWLGYYHMVAGTDGRLYYHLDESTYSLAPYDGAEWVMELPEKSAVKMNESIIKAAINYSSKCTIWVLTDLHNLYSYEAVSNQPDISSRTLRYENVQDFIVGSDSNYINILTQDGKLEQLALRKGDEPLEPLNDVAAISYDLALMQDGTIQYYRNGWHHIDDIIGDITVKKIIIDDWYRVLVLDENDTLWNYSAEDGSRVEVAQEVADFCYSAANKMTYYSYIWYATKDGSIYCNRYLWFDLTDEAETTIYPTLTGIPVDTAFSSVLLQQQDGSYLYFIPEYDSDGNPKMTTIPIQGTYAFLGLSNYSIVGIDGLLHFHQDEYPDERYGIHEEDWVISER